MIAVIGIDRYRNWQQLNNAVRDAESMISLFDQIGFAEVIPPLLDEAATGHAIQSLVTDDLTTLDENDSLILFYAGHGGTRTQRLGASEIQRGYLIPIDGSQKVATWVEFEDWVRRISTLPPRHILVILDACFAGSALRRIIRRGRDASSRLHDGLDTVHARRSRQLITSALDDQIALDAGPMHGHSLFLTCLVQGLRDGLVGNYPRDGGRVTTGFDIGHYLRQSMLAWPDAERYGPRQTPDFGCFDYDDRGEMLIPLPVGERGADPAGLVRLLLPLTGLLRVLISPAVSVDIAIQLPNLFPLAIAGASPPVFLLVLLTMALGVSCVLVAYCSLRLVSWLARMLILLPPAASCWRYSKQSFTMSVMWRSGGLAPVTVS